MERLWVERQQLSCHWHAPAHVHVRGEQARVPRGCGAAAVEKVQVDGGHTRNGMRDGDDFRLLNRLAELASVEAETRTQRALHRGEHRLGAICWIVLHFQPETKRAR